MHIKSLGNYLRWVIKNCNQAIYERKMQPILRLSHFKYSEKFGYDLCIIQVIGKNAHTEITAKELIDNPSILRAFSHEDVAKIASMSEHIKNNICKKTIKLIAQNRHQDKENSVVLQEAGNSMTMEVSLSQVSTNKNLINKLDASDAYIIGHANGTRDGLKEANAFNVAKNQHKKKCTLLTINKMPIE